MMRRALLGLCVSMLLASGWCIAPARAGTTGTLIGRVVDSVSGAPVSAARVGLVSPSQSTSTTTDANGSYRFLSLPPDTYTLSVGLAGYEPIAQAGVTIQADQTLTINVPLVKSLQTIGRVRARAAADLIKPGTTSDVYSVNGAAAEAAGALGGPGGLGNAYSAISSVPGTVVQQGQQGWYQALSIRGGDIDQVGYELDGIPVNRVYDNAPQTMLSSLGQQELQVYTGGTPATSDGQGLSGYVNQVVKTGTYPGFATTSFSIGAPTFYHRASFEFGGSTQNRLFSYYFGVAGQNQDYRYYDQNNGASDPRFVYPLYWPEGQYNIYDGTPGGPVLFSPGQTYSIASASNRDTVANLHIGIPHHRDTGKDDIQLLWLTSEFFNSYFSSVNDQGGPAQVALAVGNSGNAFWHDGYVYNGPLFAPPDKSQVAPYYFMSSPANRPLFAPLGNNARDTNDNGVGVLKLQYQKNLNARSYARIFGYSVYSNWFITGESNQNFTNFYGAELNDYEIPSHTYGASGVYSNQLNDKHLLTLSGTYSATKIQRRYFYGFPGQQSLSTPFTNLIDPATAPSTGLCYGLTGSGSSVPGNVTCFGGGNRGTFTQPVPFDPGAFTFPGGVKPQWIATESGPLGRLNHVNPIFTAASLTDNWRPSDKLTFNLGVRFENYLNRLANTDGVVPANRSFWVAAFNNEFCYRPGVFGATNISGKAPFDPTAGKWATAANCTTFAGPGYLPANFVNQNGSGKISATVLQPRAAFTYEWNPDTVVRASYGIYSRPVNVSWLQYDNLNDRDFTLYAARNFIGYGFNTPRHDLQPDTSSNFDLSLEKHLKGTDISFKATPFYRTTKNQLQAFPIGVGGIVSGFNVGQQRSYGLELALRKGDFARDGLSGQLAYTYTHSRIKYAAFPSGTSVIDSVNLYVQEYNSYTSACATITSTNSRLCGLAPGTTNPNAKPSFPAASSSGTVPNPYYNQPAQALFDPGGEYTTYDQIPQVFVGSNGYETPNVLALIVNYKRGQLNLTPSLTYSSGSNYGSPLSYAGYYPNGGCKLDSGGKVIPYTCTGQSSPISGQSFLLIPDAFTGKFDGLGAFQEPSRLTLNMAIGYQATKRLKATLTLTGIVDQCYQRGYAWDDPHFCVYSELPSGGAAVGPSGNFLPLNKTPLPLRFPYSEFNNNLNTGFVGVTIPLQATLTVDVKL
jgi:hypothetical protein